MIPLKQRRLSKFLDAGPSLTTYDTKADEKTAFVFVFLLACLPVLAVVAPRFLAYGPSLIALALYVCRSLNQRSWKPRHMHSLYAALAIVGLALVSSLWSAETGVTLERAGKMLLVLVPGALGLGALHYLPADTVRRYLWLVPLSIGICLGLVCIELLFDMPLNRLFNGMQTSDYANPSNLNRPTVTAVLSFFIALAILKSRQQYIAMAGLAGLILVVLIQTQSQSAILAILTGGVLFTFMPVTIRPVWAGLFVMTAVLTVCAPFICLALFGHVDGLGASPLQSFFENSYAAERLEIWHFVSAHILQHPWLGYGIEATRNIIFETEQLYYHGNSVLHPHNFALQIWIEFGVIGVVMACGLFAALLRVIYSHKDALIARMEIATVYAAIAVAAVGYGMWQGWWLGLMILLFFYAGLFRLSRQAEAV